MGTGPTGWGCHLLKVTAGPALTNLVLREQGRTRGNGALGVFQASLMNGGRKMENFSFFVEQGTERERSSGYPAHKTGGFFQNCSWPHPVPIPALFSASSRAGTAGHTMPPIHLAPFSLAWAFVGFFFSFSFFFLFFFLKFPCWTFHEGQADPLLLYVNASNNVQAII